MNTRLTLPVLIPLAACGGENANSALSTPTIKAYAADGIDKPKGR